MRKLTQNTKKLLFALELLSSLEGGLSLVYINYYYWPISVFMAMSNTLKKYSLCVSSKDKECNSHYSQVGQSNPMECTQHI